jgi:deoxyribonuclease-4
MTDAKDLLIGAHTSAAGGAYKALLEGKEIGATTIQLFTANQRRWDSQAIDQTNVDLWHNALKETGIKEIMSHDSYLINLGAPDEENLRKSRQAFHEETIRCLQLGITYLNFHPGAALKEDRQLCLDRICESLLEIEKVTKNSPLRFLLEATAGQGSTVGCRFEELAYIIEKVKGRIKIGVCIDTCHIFVAGYDLRTAEACDATLKEFDRIIGLEHLYAFHINDSVKGLGSRVDRHAALGKGEIGLECFKFLMNDPRTRNLPKYLETPDGPPLWKEEIAMLRQFAKTN